MNTHVWIYYRNHRGELNCREIVPEEGGAFFGSTQWHPEEQWLLRAFDVGKQADRTFALRDIHGWRDSPPERPRICKTCEHMGATECDVYGKEHPAAEDCPLHVFKKAEWLWLQPNPPKPAPKSP